MLRPLNSALWNDPMELEGAPRRRKVRARVAVPSEWIQSSGGFPLLAGTLPNKTRGTGSLFGADVSRLPY